MTVNSQTDLADLPPLRDALEAHGLMANKALGQHFLLDLNITRKIVRLGGPYDGDVVIEVGPGPGGLTRALLETCLSQLIVIEKDHRFIAMLEEIRALSDNRLIIHHEDALKVDESALLADCNSLIVATSNSSPPSNTHIVSNLPYNVGTPLLIKWLTGNLPIASLTLMFQLEVAERIVAPYGSSVYGRLSVLSQILCETELVMTVPARAFTPPPKIDSAVVKLVPKADSPSNAIIRRLEIVTAAAFGQRRKMLRAALKPLGGEALLNKAGIDPTLRADQLAPLEFLRLAVILEEQSR